MVITRTRTGRVLPPSIWCRQPPVQLGLWALVSLNVGAWFSQGDEGAQILIHLDEFTGALLDRMQFVAGQIIGADRYVKVEPKPIHALGNNLKSLYGLQEPGSVSVDGSQLRFVYHGDLRQDQLMALDLSLHPLEFVKTAELVSVTTQEVPLNLYVADGEVPLRVERLKSRNDYLLSTDATLERGRVYAITTNGLLTPKDDADFRKIAPALRLAFPVELR